MLVVISDLHFTDGTAGENNIRSSAFRDVFRNDIISLVSDEKKDIKTVKLLLLGDVFDLIRTERWFEVDPADRPWGSEGLKDIPTPRFKSATEEKALEIMGVPEGMEPGEEEKAQKTILSKNREIVQLFREFGSGIPKEDGKKVVPVEVIYVPGNHDRICNLYPSMRKKVAEALGLAINPTTVEGDPNGDWRFKWEFRDDDYGVFARHGHQFDAFNYQNSKDLSHAGHLQVPVGDVLTTEFIVKIPYELTKLRYKYPEVTDELIRRVKEVDNVRPLPAVLEWLNYKIKRETSNEVKKALDEAIDNVTCEIIDSDYMKNWHCPDTWWDEAARLLTKSGLRGISKSFIKWADDEVLLKIFTPLYHFKNKIDKNFFNKDAHTKSAYEESVWKENAGVSHILYGHTHSPLMCPLDIKNGREIYYLNTGTWRNSVLKTVAMDSTPDFVELDHMTYTVFYNKDEDKHKKVENTRSFDVWSGFKRKDYSA